MGVIEIEGLHKEYAGSAAGGRSRSRARPRRSPRAACSGSSGRTAPARRRRSAVCSGWCGRARAGSTLLGADVQRDLPSVIGRVGSIVEAPAMFPRFSGRRNLEILARDPRRGRAAIDAALERVGLADRAKDRGEDLLARHEAAAGDRGRAAEGSRAADPGRAGQRARPGGHRRGARADPLASAPRDARSSSRATSCPRCNRPPTMSRSSRRAGWSQAGPVDEVLSTTGGRER